MPRRKAITKREIDRMSRQLKLASEGTALLKQEEKTGTLSIKEMSRRQRKAVASYYAWQATLILFGGEAVVFILTVLALPISSSVSIAVFVIGSLVVLGLALKKMGEAQKGRENPAIPVRSDLTINDLKNMDPIEFERFVAGIYQKYGFRVELTPHTGDQGVDVKAWRDDKLRIIQCKRYSGKVGVVIVRALEGSRQDLKAEEAALIATGGFTDVAKEYAWRNGIKLYDSEDLIRLMANIESRPVEI